MHETKDSVVSFYQGQNVFMTGVTGMLGTAYVSRLVLELPVEAVYVLVRGGETRMWDCWGEHLPSATVSQIRESGKVVAWDGDITAPNFGLSLEQLDIIRAKATIIVHSASTINLRRSVAQLVPSILLSSVALAELALECPNLNRFVYVSTAYSSAFLREAADGSISGHDATIIEGINHIRSDECASPAAELSDIETFGSTPEYIFARHPFPYSYTKHLTERFILERFCDAKAESKLIILRPSCIGPAEAKPYPKYEVPGSAPCTAFFAYMMVAPPIVHRFSSHLAEPSKALLDEVPVDIVVNRLIVHVAFGSSGCVHAVAGVTHNHQAKDLWYYGVRHRRLCWGRPTLKWCNTHWNSCKISAVARLFVLFGTAFRFQETKTESVWGKMNQVEQATWPLWPSVAWTKGDMWAGREQAALVLMRQFMEKRSKMPTSFLRFMFKPVAAVCPPDEQEASNCSIHLLRQCRS